LIIERSIVKMPRFGRAFDARFGPHWPSYVLQSLLASVSVFVVLVTLHRHNLAVAASLAATAFTVFAMPGSITASMRNVIGGHLVGLTFGAFFSFFPQETPLAKDAVYALAVGAAMFTMTLTNTEHPPAAGTALGVVIAGCTTRIVLGVIVGITLLALIHRLLKPILRDLVAVKPRDRLNLDDRFERD